MHKNLVECFFLQVTFVFNTVKTERKIISKRQNEEKGRWMCDFSALSFLKN